MKLNETGVLNWKSVVAYFKIPSCHSRGMTEENH